ncbi:hypothetical protein EMIT013CA1_250013 [Bacillus sp. IT-13CA1]
MGFLKTFWGYINDKNDRKSNDRTNEEHGEWGTNLVLRLAIQ